MADDEKAIEGRVGHERARLARSCNMVQVAVEQLTRGPSLFLHQRMLVARNVIKPGAVCAHP